MEVKLNSEVNRSLRATCPDCRGPLSETNYDGLREYECLVGHRYSPRNLLHAHSEAQETALWGAVVALEEAANLVEALSDSFPPAVTGRLQEQVAKKLDQALVIRRILQEMEMFETEPRNGGEPGA
jgi:two-component system chemotaxis response regulator CheB